MEPAPSHGRDETPFERADRNLGELLGELRVALPGVQVLFAFLLIVPFNDRFDDVTALQRDLYLGTLICTAFASALLIAPSMYHRLEFHLGDKEHLVKVSNRLTIAGLTLMAFAMIGVTAMLTDFVFGTVAAVTTTAAVGLAFALFWYLLPLQRRRTLSRRRSETGGSETQRAP